MRIARAPSDAVSLAEHEDCWLQRPCGRSRAVSAVRLVLRTLHGSGRSARQVPDPSREELEPHVGPHRAVLAGFGAAGLANLWKRPPARGPGYSRPLPAWKRRQYGSQGELHRWG